MAKALECQALYGGSLQVALLEIGAIDEAHLEAALERTYGVRNAVDVRNDLADDSALEILRPYEAENMRLVPWRRDGKTLHIVVADPSNVVLLDKLSTRWGARIQLTVVSEPRLALLLEQYFHVPCPDKLRECLEPHEPPPQPGVPGAPALVVDPQAQHVAISDQGSGHMPTLTIGALDLPPPRATAPRARPPEPAQPPQPARQSQPPPQAQAQARQSQPPQARQSQPPQQVQPAGGPGRPRFQTMELLVPLEQQTPPPAQPLAPPTGAGATLEAAAPAAQPAATAPDVSGVTNLFLLQLHEVERREAVAPLVVSQLLKYFKRAAVLTVRRNIVSGWEAAGPGVNRADFESMKVNLEEPRNVFEPVAKGAIHMGSIDAFPANVPLITAMGGVPAEFALIAPIKVKDRVVAMLYGEADEASLERTLKPVRNIAEAVGSTFLRLILLLRTEEKAE